MKDYKKILEGVVNIINTTEKSDIGFANICTYIGENCPELKSEDEKIRKALIRYHKSTIDIDGIKGDKIVSWLEEQSNKDKLIQELGEYKVKYTQEVLENHINSMNNKNIERLRKTTIDFLKEFADKGYENAVECIAWLEKQGEQKPDDKTEPKFKVGDCVVDNCGYVWRIEGILNKFYILEGVDGGESRPTIEWVNNTFHHWTIQDAKDGDVLYFSDETIVIFKDLYNATTFHSYCHIENGIFDISKNEMPDWWEGEGFKPATKEQRDTLMKVMTDAGYTFNFDKKELKKIEQKPTWSYEDEINYNYALAACLYYGETKGYTDTETHQKTIDWLKSLKDRVQPQPKQEWSEDDKNRFSNLIYLVEHSDEQLEALESATENCAYSEYQDCLRELIGQLKKLKG